MRTLLFLVIVTAAFLLACGDGEYDPPPKPDGILTSIAMIGDDMNFPLMDESCWDWFPDGDGLLWGRADLANGLIIRFPFRNVSVGRATIEELGEIKDGDVVFLRYNNGALEPIFKIIEINQAKGGVKLALIGNISGSCQAAPTS